MKGVESMFRRPGLKQVAYLQNHKGSFHVCVCERERLRLSMCVHSCLPMAEFFLGG